MVVVGFLAMFHDLVDTDDVVGFLAMFHDLVDTDDLFGSFLVVFLVVVVVGDVEVLVEDAKKT